MKTTIEYQPNIQLGVPDRLNNNSCFIQNKKLNTAGRLRAKIIRIFIAVLLLNAWYSLIHASEGAFTQVGFSDAINRAIYNDPWLFANYASQQAILAKGNTEEQWENPNFSVDVTNLAADTFDFNQEPMTQFKIGFSQKLPRGDSNKIRALRAQELAAQHPFQRQDRMAKVAVTVGSLWLDVYKDQESIRLIESSKGLFKQLADIAQANYASTIGKTRQQDIVQAQLELTQLEDRLISLTQRKHSDLAELKAWQTNLHSSQASSELRNNRMEVDRLVNNSKKNVDLHEPSIDAVIADLPNLKMLSPASLANQQMLSIEKFNKLVQTHPAIKALEKLILAEKESVKLAEQSKKPEFSLNTSYAFRADNEQASDMFSGQRSDLFSIGISFDMPIFNSRANQGMVNQAVGQLSKAKQLKWLKVKQMYRQLLSVRSQLIGLLSRKKLFESDLLPQLNQHTEASLTAYTNDEGKFSEVVRARINQLNASLDYLEIKVAIQKNILQLNYFFCQEASQVFQVKKVVKSIQSLETRGQ